MRSCLIYLLSFTCSIAAACDSLAVRKNTLSAQLTLSQGITIHKANAGFNAYYLHGSADYYLANCFSVGGDAYAQVGYRGTLSTASIFIERQYDLFFGASYHKQKGMHDLSVGIQPGIGLSRSSFVGDRNYVFSPLFSSVLNYNLWMSPYFRLFIQGRLVAGTHINSTVIPLTETRVSAGLAFALPIHVKRGAH